MMIRRIVLPILASSLWISLSEFVRNSFLLHSHWATHYQSLGMTFPEQPINGAVWGIWSLCFAITIYMLNTRFSRIETTLLSWFVGFVFMWLVIGNLGVLPFGILPLAIPLSLLEAFVASLIIQKLTIEKSG